MRFFIVTIALVFFYAVSISIKNWLSAREKKKPIKKMGDDKENEEKKNKKEDKSTKKGWATFGQRIKWVWIIILVVIPFTWWVGGAIWRPTFKSIMGAFFASSIPTATVQWWKDPTVYGAHPSVRSGGPYKARVLRSDSRFDFVTPNAVFEGEKTNTRNDGERMGGTWSQSNPEKDGGEWYLIADSNNSRMFVGKYTDKSREWINFSLKIDLK